MGSKGLVAFVFGLDGLLLGGRHLHAAWDGSDGGAGRREEIGQRRGLSNYFSDGSRLNREHWESEENVERGFAARTRLHKEEDGQSSAEEDNRNAAGRTIGSGAGGQGGGMSLAHVWAGTDRHSHPD